MSTNTNIHAKDCIHYNFGASHDNRRTNSIFIYAETGVVFQGLVQSLERTFSDIKIDLSNYLPDIQDQDLSVGLVLLHIDLVDDLSECIERCRISFPNASITLMINGDGAGSHGLSRLFGDKRIQGLLPFTLKLDIWLAAIWLLLNGGEYYPYGVMQSLEQIAKENPMRGRQPATTNGFAGRITESKPIDTLTLRERQILEFIAEGLQNKTIADRLNLSGHTVKVHVHNLIRKLKVHNRTQAAAIYRNYLEQSSLQSSAGWNTQRAINRFSEMTESLANA
ncbi:helix-turn-helix transcriptional regulator [Phyllobacterium myrsinacearum]|uniref:DNA-binding NarL/FixJ family response regulator n=1 Tax=Phyllobacterium myrsinacearum TaxID=28101 RepID=A0A839EJE0_9HYPH|nr:response regulator transcription factor [Phyllobacterium myrsinacearum]MBA8878919.1 DNA-binding NarL/FixJ family response regulator [Phyllobacterium myrsinacearum]